MIWLSRDLTVSSATPTTIRIVVPPIAREPRLLSTQVRAIGKIAIIHRKNAPTRVIFERTRWM